MTTMTSQITGVLIVYSTVGSGADQRKHQSSVSLSFVWPVDSPSQRPSNAENVSIWWRYHAQPVLTFLSTKPLEKQLSEMWFEIHTISWKFIWKKIVCRWRPFCPGLTFGHGFVHTGAFMDAVLENKDIWLILMWYLGPNSWWRHQMETISVLLALCAGNSPVSGESPSQTPVTVVFSLICAWTNGWVNNRNAGDLRRGICCTNSITINKINSMCTHDVRTVMWIYMCIYHLSIYQVERLTDPDE